MNSIKAQCKRETIFMNSENSKTSASHRLLFNLPDKIGFKMIDKYVALSNRKQDLKHLLKLHSRIIWRQLKVKQEIYQKKDIYLQKKDSKLIMI